eukprot:TRINITY_DN699_c0_g1_i12.p1 TRINITY_DN699_c0_g1~~TRINITY_DN699_c0_g1_i12.p1  ORF type:complete len:100 (+),score=19.39 TRINITY_DN699_c0_g1_i12:3023-3322(+)
MQCSDISIKTTTTKRQEGKKDEELESEREEKETGVLRKSRRTRDGWIQDLNQSVEEGSSKLQTNFIENCCMQRTEKLNANFKKFRILIFTRTQIKKKPC